MRIFARVATWWHRWTRRRDPVLSPRWLHEYRQDQESDSEPWGIG